MSIKEFLARLEIFQLKMRRLKSWQPLQGNQKELAALEQERDTLRDDLSTYNPANRLLKQPLTLQDREVLLVMLDRKADMTNIVTREDLADAIGGGDPQKITQHLRDEGLVDGKRGVGVWLTEKGWKLAETLPRNTEN